MKIELLATTTDIIFLMAYWIRRFGVGYKIHLDLIFFKSMTFMWSW